MTAIKTHFDGKVFVPDEPVNLKRGQVAIVHVPTQEPESSALPPDGAAAAGESVWDWMAAHPIDDPTLPRDLSQNLDHYLYGAPKRSSKPSGETTD